MTTHSGPGVSTGRDQGAGEPVLTPEASPVGAEGASDQGSDLCPDISGLSIWLLVTGPHLG